MNTVKLYHMNGFFIMLKPTIKAIYALGGSWTSGTACFIIAFFGIDMIENAVHYEALIKAIAALVTVGLAFLTYILSRKEKAAQLQSHELDLKQKEEDQTKENVAWLIQMGWIPKNPSIDEIQDGLKKLKNINSHSNS